MTKITAVVPAHNEEAVLGAAILSLKNQNRKIDSIVVVADNCTDRTTEIAAKHGATVFETKDNSKVKAGALNQAFAFLMPHMTDDDMILVMDADGALDKEFVGSAINSLDTQRGLGAVGGTFRGDSGGGVVGYLQRNEYARYERDVRRMKGKCLVVTGTAAVFRVETLRRVSEARLAGDLPAGDGQGGVYDTSVLTEDNELTFALMHLGYKVLCPPGCTLVTEVMPTWGQLWNQRLRWKRGAIENCFQYGITKITWRYWGRQLLTAVGILITLLYFLSIVFSFLSEGGLTIHPAWLAVTGVFVLERVVTVSYRGWKHMLLAATMVEVLYDIFLQVVHAKAYIDAAFSRERNW